MKRVKLYLFLFLSFGSHSALAGTFVTISDINFQTVIAQAGNCRMDATTAAITDIGGSIICQQNNTGILGHYRIFTDPFRSLSIRIKRRNPVSNDGVTFIPDGVITSDTESKPIAVDGYVTIAAGPTGIINIVFGGELQITRNLQPDNDFSFSFIDGIEWNEN